MKPFMRLPTGDVYQLRDINNIKSMVRLTKWLQPIQAEFIYLTNEYKRIMKDPKRYGYIVYSAGKIALFVNDLTDGAFDKLSEEDEDA